MIQVDHALSDAAARSGVNRYMIALLLHFIVSEKKVGVLQASTPWRSACDVEVSYADHVMHDGH